MLTEILELVVGLLEKMSILAAAKETHETLQKKIRDRMERNHGQKLRPRRKSSRGDNPADVLSRRLCGRYLEGREIKPVHAFQKAKITLIIIIIHCKNKQY